MTGMRKAQDANGSRLLAYARTEIETILGSLPGPLAKAAGELTVTLEAAPSAALVQDGLAPDTLGLYMGMRHPDADSGMHELPAQILLYLDNIWLYARGDVRCFREEVRKTYLHELGHYLGLEEEDLEKRGLF